MIHVLNGDSLAASFNSSGIQGNAIIWREGFALGPVTEKIETKRFLLKRKAFWETFNPLKSKDFPVYHESFVPELTKICNLNPSTHVTLWFEHDLFCQANMLALLSLLNRLAFTNISLVCIDQHPDHPNFKGLGNLSPAELFYLLPSAQKLADKDVAFASALWQLYCLPSPLPLQEFQPRIYPAAFPFLKKAIAMHLAQFPSIYNGLNELQTEILNKISKGINKQKLLRELLKADDLYGYGDLAFMRIISDLSGYYNGDDHITLNSEGKDLLNGSIDFFDTFTGIYQLGGTILSSPPAFRRGSKGIVPS